MRITSGMVRADGLAAIQRNLRGIRDAQADVLDGRRVRSASDDPSVATTLMTGDGRLRALEQYRRNIAAARSRLESEESVLGQLGDVVSRARELAISQATGTANAHTRAVTAAEVKELLATVVQLANTRHGTAYLFGGMNSMTPPLDAAGDPDPALPPVGAPQFQVADGQLMFATHDAQDIFITTDVVDSLRALITGLDNDSATDISAANARLVAAFDAVQTLLGEVGARTVRLEVAESNIDALHHNLLVMHSDIAGVDLEEAVSRLVARQSAFEAALLATSRVLQNTLTNYLR